MGNENGHLKIHLRGRGRGHGSSKMKVIHAQQNMQLVEASSRGKTDIIDLLLEDGAAINFQDKRGETSLMWAVKNRHIHVVKSLLENGADLDVQNSFGFTALHYAVSPWKPTMQMDILNILISKGASLDIFDGECKTPLMKACRFSNFTAAIALIDAGADVNLRSPSKDGYTAMHEAVQLFNMLQSLQGEDYARRVLDSSIEPVMLALRQFFMRVRSAGGHADIPDRHGHDILWHVMQSTRHSYLVNRSSPHRNANEESLRQAINSLYYPLSLKCLAAKCVVSGGIWYRSRGALPKPLIHFVDMHNPVCINEKQSPTGKRQTPQFLDWYSS